jgi:hypothetical protein
MLVIVVENTNKYIDSVSVNYSDHDKYKAKRTTLSEIKACIGLLYMARVFKSNRQNLTKLKRRITPPAREPEEKRPKLQCRCAICPRSKDRKTKYMCQKCEKFLCLQHVVPLCEERVCA